MNFGAMQTLIQETLKRPDKAPQVKSAINRVLEEFVRRADWYADLVEVTTNITPTLYVQSLVIATAYPNFRKMSYIRPTDLNKKLTYVAPDKIITPDGLEQRNVWYRSGANIIIALYELAATLEVGYFKYYAYLVGTSDTHWMLDAMPSAVHDEVLSQLYGTIGNDAEARFYKAQAAISFQSAERDLASGARQNGA